MRCVIAHFPFDLFASEVQQKMKGVKPEPVTGASVIIGRRTYPVMQVGELITRQDRRDFSAGEVMRALTRLGFTVRALPPQPPVEAVPAPAVTPAPAADPISAENMPSLLPPPMHHTPTAPTVPGSGVANNDPFRPMES
ncbi:MULTISPECIES: SCO5918 family protein [unclassified Streptomyces]|uniref:SCO5918 family protein n=1 Tax=unclassified Streptomyces TaxID=2593676 RepID=UPI002DD7DD65|nr:MULTISPECIES: SCO5918 family protein [unclassified Streptomyces]WSA96000.1 SCO5918 family protein [Streptomyces sp. NBC_01795]WSB80416.1 SCO5918 family protein [Streptomyces sp. NBC_01775]WSS11379.1 SCO5918 family protein [Streptomyces sp. NBC_01186]WSS40085.1 SCO5918 family protein [Streptomyces sp. NBC_01187]